MNLSTEEAERLDFQAQTRAAGQIDWTGDEMDSEEQGPPEFEVCRIKVSSITLEAGTQLRDEEFDSAVVERYADKMRRGATFPPIVIFEDEDGARFPGDGHHRTRAAILAGLPEILAEVRPGSQRDAILYSCGANEDHGVARTNKDKRRQVRRVLIDEEWQKWGNAEIARVCKVSAPFVAKMRRELFGDGPREALGADGKVYTVPARVPTVDEIEAAGLAQLEEWKRLPEFQDWHWQPKDLVNRLLWNLRELEQAPLAASVRGVGPRWSYQEWTTNTPWVRALALKAEEEAEDFPDRWGADLAELLGSRWADNRLQLVEVVIRGSTNPDELIRMLRAPGLSLELRKLAALAAIQAVTPLPELAQLGATQALKDLGVELGEKRETRLKKQEQEVQENLRRTAERLGAHQIAAMDADALQAFLPDWKRRVRSEYEGRRAIEARWVALGLPVQACADPRCPGVLIPGVNQGCSKCFGIPTYAAARWAKDAAEVDAGRARAGDSLHALLSAFGAIAEADSPWLAAYPALEVLYQRWQAAGTPGYRPVEDLPVLHDDAGGAAGPRRTRGGEE